MRNRAGRSEATGPSNEGCGRDDEIPVASLRCSIHAQRKDDDGEEVTRMTATPCKAAIRTTERGEANMSVRESMTDALKCLLGSEWEVGTSIEDEDDADSGRSSRRSDAVAIKRG